MKDSSVLKKRWLQYSFFAASLVYAEEGYLSGIKEEQFRYDYRKASLQSDILRDSWLAPIQTYYSYGKSKQYGGNGTTQTAAVSIDQPIFQSGGIYYGIKFAEASRKYANLSVDAARTKAIKEAVDLLMRIRQSDLKIQKQDLLIANAGLNLELKTEQYLHGELDSGFLDNAIIEKNLQTQALYDMQTARERLISAYEAISDLPHKDAVLPKLSLLNETTFSSDAIDMQLARSDIEKGEWNQKVTLAKYLPRISLNTAYNWNRLENPAFAGTIMPITAESDYLTYGMKASVVFDVNQRREMEVARIETLKANTVMEDKKRFLQSLYDQVKHNLENSDKKIALAKSNRDLYEKLLLDTRELFRAGYKTEYDVNMLDHSAKIQTIEIQILEYDRQLELLNLYEKVNGAI